MRIKALPKGRHCCYGWSQTTKTPNCDGIRPSATNNNHRSAAAGGCLCQWITILPTQQKRFLFLMRKQLDSISFYVTSKNTWLTSTTTAATILMEVLVEHCNHLLIIIIMRIMIILITVEESSMMTVTVTLDMQTSGANILLHHKMQC